MRHVNPALGAILLGALVGGVLHVVLVVIKTGLRVVARREVDVLAQGRVCTVAALEGEAGAGSLVVRVDLASHGSVRIFRVRRNVVVLTGACPLHSIDGNSIVRVEVEGTARSGGRSCQCLASYHLQSKGEGLDLVIGGLEEVVHVHVKQRDLLELASLGILEEQTGDPVVALVVLNLSRCALGVDQDTAIDNGVEVASSHDSVVVAGLLARADDGVDGTLGQELVAVEAEDGKGAVILGRSQGG